MRMKPWIGGVAMAAMCGSGAAAQDWQFSVTPYMWASGLSGDLGAIPGFPATNVDLSFSDILDDLVYGAFLTATARNGPWSILFDGSSVKTSSTEKIGGATVNDVKVETVTSNATLGVGYQLVAGPTYALDGFVGARWWTVKNDFKVGLQDGTTARQDSDENWVDPLIGIVYRKQFNPRWSLMATASGGGFGVGADSTWGGSASVFYAFNDTVSAAVGYRYLSVDYDNDGFVYDVVQSGPLLGLSFRF